MDLERRLQQPLRQGHGSERQVDGEAYVQRDNLTGSLVQTPGTLQLALCVGQRVVELGEGEAVATRPIARSARSRNAARHVCRQAASGMWRGHL